MELDALSKELHLLTEHGVALDANFSKFGYSAHLSKWGAPAFDSPIRVSADQVQGHTTRVLEATPCTRIIQPHMEYVTGHLSGKGVKQ